MSQIKPPSSVRSDLSDRLMTISLIHNGPDDIWIRSCEVLGTGFRSRFSFHEKRRVEDVLVARLAHAIAVNLRKIPDGAHVLALPEFLIEVPGLILSGVHIMVTEVTGSARSIILRFKEFIGGASNAFRVDVGFEEPLTVHGQKLAISVLDDICLPLLNLCHLLENTANQFGYKSNERLKDRIEEFRFQTELLKRYATHLDGPTDRLPAAYSIDHNPPPYSID